MKKLPVILFAFAVLCFFFLKVTNLGVKLSDTNIYFYTAYAMLHGKTLYQDIFFTNFPLLPYISMFYVLLTGGNLPLFYLTAPLEAIVVACIIFALIKRETKSAWLSFLSASLYLFSFIVLSTSDHQTGVFLASLFAITSYWFYKKQRPFFSGVCIALALLTKAYFLPVLLAFLVVFWIEHRPKLLRFLLGGVATSIVLLLPSLFLTPRGIFNDVFLYSLTRTVGLPKTQIGWFFVFHDTLFFILLLFAIITIRKRLFFGTLSLMGILFFFLYKDVYYLYLNFLPPFLSLVLPEFISDLKARGVQQLLVPTCMVVLLSITFFIYYTSFRSLDKIPHIQEIVQEVKRLHPGALYGTNDITPALSYLTGVPVMNGIIDTNTNIFNKGLLSARTLTADAVASHAVLIAHGTHFPGIIDDPLTDTIFDKKIVEKSCTLKKTYPIYAEGPTNEIALYVCSGKR